MSQQPQPYKVRRIHVVAKGADVSNPGTAPCRFLLIQAGGQYDFVREE